MPYTYYATSLQEGFGGKRQFTMALLNGGVDTDIIRLIGRWRSDKMLRYLHVQAEPYGISGEATKIGRIFFAPKGFGFCSLNTGQKYGIELPSNSCHRRIDHS
jgi:hypothetical protein